MVNAAKNKSMIVILSSPSGGGKTSITKKLLEQDSNLSLSISATRPVRFGEQEHYFFKSRAEFNYMIETNQFLEFAEIYGNAYGTSEQHVEKALTEGLDVLFDIDSQGVYEIIKKMQDRVVNIFIIPPDIDILRTRLDYRRQDSQDVIDQRMKLAREEIMLKTLII
eukprot:GHVR01080877.1.p1 GENE.GHVR01080877.1~~GHVR01080877.1.p1  ORF type:complete len:166 (+),score=16.15 GHVR01080877.1:831-1328(+)